MAAVQSRQKSLGTYCQVSSRMPSTPVAPIRERAEVLFDSVEVNRAVAVEACGRSALLLLDLVGVVDVVVPGREPDGCDAQLFQVRQVVDDSLKVAAVVVELVRAVVESARLRRGGVCGGGVRGGGGGGEGENVVG